MVRVRNLMLIFALLATTGVHWAILQSFAWTTMFAQNLRTERFTEAVTQTFDGQHPCDLCKAIAKGKNSTNRVEFTAAPVRFEFPLAPGSVFVIAHDRTTFAPVTNEFAESRSHQPPTPPPRAFCA